MADGSDLQPNLCNFVVLNHRMKIGKNMTPIRIDINDYFHSGEGSNGESYYHKADPAVMMKLYFASAPYEIIENELVLAQKVYDLGLPTPKPGDFITDGNGRYGIRFQRIVGKKSFARAIGEEPHRVETYARDFAQMCLKLHSTHVGKTQFPNMKEVNLEMLENNPYFNDDERKWVKDFMATIPDTDTALHGDLHFGNAIMANDGNYFIDLGDFAYGHPYFDLGQVLLTCCYDDEDFVCENFHMALATANEFWKYFVKEYFGENANLEEVTAMIRPYSGLKTLLIERNAGVHMPQFHVLLR